MWLITSTRRAAALQNIVRHFRSYHQRNDPERRFQQLFDRNSKPHSDRMEFAGNSLRPTNFDNLTLSPIEKNLLPSSFPPTPLPELEAFLSQHQAQVKSQDPITNLLSSFQPLPLPPSLLSLLQQWTPTPIQQIAIPIALSGRDLVAISQTGSGKTIAFTLPGIIHSLSQPLSSPSSPHLSSLRMIVLAPTRELASQIHDQIHSLISALPRSTPLRSVCVFGGSPRHSQIAKLRDGCDILVATPGRLLDFLEQDVLSLNHVSYVVLDEADRMLDMGFEPQIRRVMGQIRPDRQTLMFSATWPASVQGLARDFCQENPVKVTVGDTQLTANPNISQIVKVLPETAKKQQFLKWLEDLGEDRLEKRMIVFCNKKADCDNLCRELRFHKFAALTIHGDKEQRERDRILNQFRNRSCNVLIATDVAARGLDVKDIEYVVNYDMPGNLEDYVHRIGRTGRAGNKGTALTFFGVDVYSSERCRMAAGLVDLIRRAGQAPPADLLDVANQYMPERNKRSDYDNRRRGSSFSRQRSFSNY